MTDSYFWEQVSDVMVNMDSQFIVFNTKTELLRLDVSKIVYFEGDGNYTQIVTINKLKAVVCLNLTQMEKYLAEHLVDCKSIFMRVGKRFIINTGYIYQVNTQKQQLILSDYEHFAFALGISKEALKQMKDLLITKNKLIKQRILWN